MSDATCATCPWWFPIPLEGLTPDGQNGQCRVCSPSRSGTWARMRAFDWCGEHPERRTPHTNLTEADVRRIVADESDLARRAILETVKGWIRNATGRTP